MRRFAAVVAVASMMTVLAGPSVPAAAQVGGGGIQWADSAWVKRSGDDLNMYFATALRFLDPGAVSPDGGLPAYGGVGKGTCVEGKHWTICSASGRIYELSTEDFEFDPLLGSARMHLETKDEVHDLLWTGRGESPDPSFNGNGSSYGVSASAGLWRHASIEGTIFGHELERRTPWWSELIEFAGADVWFGARGYRVSDDGVLTLMLRIPRF